MTCDRARGDLKVVGRGWNDGGRIQSAEIRLMYYDISVRNSCAPRRHICRGSLLEMSVMWVGGREFNQDHRENGKEKELLCEDLCVIHKERLCCEAWFQFKERERCGGGLWFWLECKQAFKGALFWWMFTFSLWNLLFPVVETASRKQMCLNGSNVEWWLVATRLSQVHKSDPK